MLFNKMKVLIALCGFAAVASGVIVQKWYNSEDGSQFYIDAENKYNWYDAWNECARKNMSLLAIDSYKKHQQIDALIRKIFPACPSFWLGGHDNAIDLRYEWVMTGEVFSFTNWGPAQPDRLNNNEHCILIWQNTWQWYDLPCSHKLGFICEENRYIKEKSLEYEALRRECQDKSNGLSKFKNVVMYFNSSPKYEYSNGNGTSSITSEFS